MLANFSLEDFVAQRFVQRLIAQAYVSHSPNKHWETQRVRVAYIVRKACVKACRSAISWRSLSVMAWLGDY